MKNRIMVAALVVVFAAAAALVAWRLMRPGGDGRRIEQPLASRPGDADDLPLAITAAAEPETLLPAPIEPDDNAVLHGNGVWIRWSWPGQTAGRVLWRKEGEGEFRTSAAAGGDTQLAHLGPVEAGASYEYVVESALRGRTLRSRLRRFSIGEGVAFASDAAEATIQRDYDQSVWLELRNGSKKPVRVAARMLAQFDDLPAGLVGPGSADEPVVLEPGKDLRLRLALAAADASRKTYEIPVEAAGAFTVARVTVKQPEFDLAFRVIEDDPQTLAKTIELTNRGEALSDLSVQVAFPNEAEVRLEPAARHAYLPPGRSLRLTAVPLLFLEFAGLDAELECRAAGRTVRFPLKFVAPPGRRLIGVRTGTGQTTSNRDWYCTNKPSTCSDVPGPSGNGPLLASAAPDFLPSPGSCASQAECNKEPCNLPNLCAEVDAARRLKDSYEKTRDAYERAKQRLKPNDTFGDVQDRVLKDVAKATGKPVEVSGETGGEYQYRNESGRPADPDSYGDPAPGQDDPRREWTIIVPSHSSGSNFRIVDQVSQMHEDGHKQMLENAFERFKNGQWTWRQWDDFSSFAGKGQQVIPYIDEEIRHYERGIAFLEDWLAKCGPCCEKQSRGAAPRPGVGLAVADAMMSLDDPPDEAEPQTPGPRDLRPGLLEAMARRAGFTRNHRGAFASPRGGDAADSSDSPAAYHGGERVWLAWHMQDRIVAAWFSPNGQIGMDPQFIGTGRRPQIAAFKDKAAVAWEQRERTIVRLHTGKAWGPPLELPGTEPALAFAGENDLLAATTTGLWRMGSGGFERLREAAWSQPSLAIDPRGQPQVAFRRDGKIFYGETLIGEGTQPALAILPDGKARIACVSDGKLVLRSQTDEGWSEPQVIAAAEPAWPALAPGTDGVRLTYIAAAERGPSALWLVREKERQPLLMPTLAGNVTESSLLVHFALRSGRESYRPHDVTISINGVVLKEFTGTVPEGRYLFPLNLHQTFTSAGRPVVNRVAIHTRHMNGGHYIVNSDYRMITRTAWSEHFAFAADEGEIRKSLTKTPGVNHGHPDLTILSNDLALPVERPKAGSIELPVQVANLGEATSRPARLVLLNGKAVLQRVELPALVPGARHAVRFAIGPTDDIESVVFQIEQDGPDFTPDNDRLEIHLWGRPAAALASRGGTGAGFDRDGSARGTPIKVLDDPEPPYLWRILDAGTGREVAHVERGRMNKPLPAGRYRLALRQYQYEGQEVVFPQVVDYREGDKLPLSVKTGIRIEQADWTGSLFEWRVFRPGKPDVIVQWHRGEHRVMLLPPGEYQMAVLPVQYHSELLVWPQTITVRDGQFTSVKLDSAVELDMPAEAGPLYSWEAVRPDKPDKPLQWHRSSQRTMLLPPGNYQIAVLPVQYHSLRLVWPEKIVVKAGEKTTVQLAGGIELDMPKEAGPLYSWEAVRPDKPDQPLQWHRGDQRTMLVPPGEYQIAVLPVQYHSQRLVWPSRATVKPNERTTVRLASTLRLEATKHAGSLFTWEIVRPEKPDEPLQQHRGDQATMLVPPGRYRVAVLPVKYHSRRLVWPETVTIAEGKPATLRLDSTLQIDWPKAAGPLDSWEVVPVDEPDSPVQSHRGDKWVMLVPPGRYRVAFLPVRYHSNRLVWPATITVERGKQASIKLDSGIQLAGPKDAKPEFELQLVDVETDKVVQHGKGTWAAQVVPPGTYRVQIRRDGRSPRQTVAERVEVQPGRISSVKLPALP